MSYDDKDDASTLTALQSAALHAPEHSELARLATKEISEARMNRMWSEVQGRVTERSRSWPSWPSWLRIAAPVMAAAALIAMFLAQRADTNASLLEGATLATASDALAVDLKDGSVVTLAPESRISVEQSTASVIHLTLERGSVDCEVTPNRERDFVVTAQGVRVRVVGTAFRVESSKGVDGSNVAVRVKRGVVEVTSPDGGVRRLTAGETWQRELSVTRTNSNAGEASNDAPNAERPQQPAGNSAAAAPPTVGSDAGRVRALPDEKRPSGANDRLARSGKTTAKPRDQFDRAMQARMSGEASGAAQLFNAFIAAHPEDPRVGVASFELGRLRMDQLGDLAGAERALTIAVHRGVGALSDDALARLVRARAALGMNARCQSARDLYLDRYPAGVHIETVRRMCP